MISTRVVIDDSGIKGLVSEANERAITLKAVRAGIKILLPQARSGAPVRSKLLRRAQGTKAVKGRKGKTGSYAVQGAKTQIKQLVKVPGRSKPVLAIPALYDHLVQGGTKAHTVGSRMHHGAKKNPYRRQAYESLKGRINDEIMKVMGIELDKVLAKNAAKMAAKMLVRK